MILIFQIVNSKSTNCFSFADRRASERLSTKRTAEAAAAAEQAAKQAQAARREAQQDMPRKQQHQQQAANRRLGRAVETTMCLSHDRLTNATHQRQVSAREKLCVWVIVQLCVFKCT